MTKSLLNIILTGCLTVIVFINCQKLIPEKKYILSAPSGDQYTEIKSDNTAIIPNGRIVTPIGKQIRVAPHPYGLILSPDNNILVTANSGTFPFSLSIISDLKNEKPNVSRIPEKGEERSGILESVFMGLAIAPDNQTLYASSGGGGAIMIFDLKTDQKIGEIDLNGDFSDGRFVDGYIGDLVMTKDGSIIYAVDQANFRMIILDVNKKQVIKNVPVGRYPFGIALSPDEKKIYVANVGMFEYSFIKGFDRNKPDSTTIKFPAFGYNTKEMVEGTTVEGKEVPGLGDPNVPESFSVWTVNVENPLEAKVTAKVKTGHLVGEKLENIPAVGGSSPNSIVASDKYVYVSNGNNDSITLINAQTNTVIKDINLYWQDRLKHLRGVIPFGLALSPDGEKLFVAESGINAVAVINTKTHNIIGHIPTGWFPSKLAVSDDGKQLYIANAKGWGAGPNAGKNHKPGDPSNVGHLMRGVISIIDMPSDKQIKKLTQKVIENNVVMTAVNSNHIKGKNPVPPVNGIRKSPIKHIVYITKENRTYDEVFGALENGLGDSSLCRYTVPRTFKNIKNGAVAKNVVAMPNHLALAKRFTISDNFYCDSDHSADGHRWLVGVYPNEWVETSVSAHYGRGKRGQSPNAKGRLGFVGASGAIYPEDYNEAGGMWEHFDRNDITFWNYGLGFEFAGSYEEQHHKYTGIQMTINYPMPRPLFERTSRMFATYNTNIPDQFRVDMFEEEFNQRWLSGKEPFPQVITMMLPNDHASSPRPDDGYPFYESYMSDNDLALGRVIEMLSNSPFWQNMAIFITEDDAQGGLDHVDAHRSLCMVLSPYAKPGYVSKTHTSIASIIKTIFLILDLPPLNQYDACTNDLSDCFTDEPLNIEPYSALPVDPVLFDPQKALDPYDKEFKWDKVNDTPPLDNPAILRTERAAKYQEWLEQQEKEKAKKKK